MEVTYETIIGDIVDFDEDTAEKWFSFQLARPTGRLGP